MEEYGCKEPTPYADIIKHILKREIKINTDQGNLEVETWNTMKTHIKG